MIGSVYDKNVFISGPLEDITIETFDLFDEVAHLMRGAQARVAYNPADRNYKKDGLFVVKRWGYEIWLSMVCGNMDVLSRTEWKKDMGVHPAFDYLVSLPRWRDSKCACIEREIAEAAGIECYDWDEIEAEIREQYRFQQQED